MYCTHDQRNVFQSLEFDPCIGPYVSTITHDRKFVQEANRPWIEVYPFFTHNWHPTGNKTQYTQTSPQFHPQQNSANQSSPQQHSSEYFIPKTTSPQPKPTSATQLSPRTRHFVPGMSEEELEERRKEAGWYSGCESEEEEEEPDFWDFFRKLAKDTQARIQQSQREYEEECDNYFVARFAFH